MEYRKVYFRIRSRYQFDSGWPAETDAAKFHEESRSLFQSAGWDLQPGGDSTSDTVTKGWQELYLHPMNFSGIIEMDEIPAIQELLKDAKSFCCYGFDCYERYGQLTTYTFHAILQFVSHQLPGRDIQALSQAIRGCIPGGSGERTTNTPQPK